MLKTTLAITIEQNHENKIFFHFDNLKFYGGKNYELKQILSKKNDSVMNKGQIIDENNFINFINLNHGGKGNEEKKVQQNVNDCPVGRDV